ncbi:L,D-transpeptidase [Leptothermofonsia sp. ETS-13]|uniref:L,D-transpeptidase n=1 Tax=Leptothermofonsia sp. ETS-13 TaxID=3035696 RepID=UPI003BA1A6A3
MSQQVVGQTAIVDDATRFGAVQLQESSERPIPSRIIPVADEESPAHLSISPQSFPETPVQSDLENQKPAVAIVLPPDPSLYQLNLPPIGDEKVYLPDEVEALGLRLIVKLSKRRVYVYERDKVIASYPIAVGKPGWETPTGEYKVFNMEKNPTFKSFKSGRIIKPGPDNPLGVRWIGIWTDGKTQLGFHGTNQPELIGQAVSHGCIRMLNKDVTALFEKVAIGTPVKVEP